MRQRRSCGTRLGEDPGVTPAPMPLHLFLMALEMPEAKPCGIRHYENNANLEVSDCVTGRSQVSAPRGPIQHGAPGLPVEDRSGSLNIAGLPRCK